MSLEELMRRGDALQDKSVFESRLAAIKPEKLATLI